MTRAVYKQREDGDWDFVAAFSSEEHWPDDWPRQIVEWLEREGETATVRELDLNEIYDVVRFRD